MATPIILSWSDVNPTLVAATQAVAQNPLTLTSSPFYFPNGVSRGVTLTSHGGADFSGVDFVITGFFGANATQETLVGPGANATVSSVNIYTSITSIAPVVAMVGNISAGSGAIGILPWIQNNWNSDVLGLGVQVSVGGTENGTVTYSFSYTNLLDPYSFQGSGVNGTILQGIIMPNPGNAEAYQTVMSDFEHTVNQPSQPAFFNIPCRWYTLFMTASDAWGGTLTAYFTRQGIK